MSIISVDNLKTFMGMPSGETTDDTILTNIIAEIEDFIQNVVCQRQFAVADHTEYYDGDGTDILLLENLPIVSVTSLYDDTDRAYGSDTLISSDDYILYKLYGYIKLDGYRFQEGSQNIKIVYRAGYGSGVGETAMPDELKRAFKQYMVAEYLIQKGNIDAVGLEGNRTRPDILKKEAMGVFDRYKNVRLTTRQ